MNVEEIASKISVIFGIQHDWKDQISGFMFPQVVQRRWDNKSSFNSVLTQQHLCKKLPKSVNVRWSYSLLHHCRFFWDTVYCVCVGLQYLRHLSTNFDNFLADSTAVVLSTVYKYYFSLRHFCVTPVRQEDRCYQLCRYCIICCYQNNSWPTQ